MKEYKNFYIFVIAIIILLLVPNLLQKGMFVDGLWYAAISKNLANGLGSFWQPMFTETMFAQFYEHPPLVFGIQSIFFTVFNDSLWIEKLYSIFIFLANIYLIKLLWSAIFYANKESQKLWFIPVLLWFLCEVVYLMYTNNVLECTQEIFILLSIILILKGIRKEKYSFFFLAGICVLLSFLSKGITGIFPLIAVVLYSFSVKKITIKQTITYSLLMLLGFATILVLFIIQPESYTNIISYFNNQVLNSLEGNSISNMQSSRFYIIKKLFQVHLLPIILVLIISLISYFKLKTSTFFQHKKQIFFFLLLGLSGVLPIMISEKQASYYLITTAPFFAVALSLICVQNKEVIQRLSTSKIFTFISIGLLVTSIFVSFNNIGKINNRDKILLEDLTKLEVKLQKGVILGCKTEKRYDALYGFMMRNYEISLDTLNPYNYKTIISDVNLDKKEFVKVDIHTKQFNLYIKK
ncbi:hypothetical protein LPB136_03960 [Tenacibaculum todarodis]|uniref:Uncharacterized protein n=1 Tax=Tenacibaculum todarodis TaxID=1850252 RepID=A0A1L3JHJ0_9FLAO|nr:glycosyltransferase family 39 protein [Tenacibaculum todarodis]APG64572.1 hypothetical protein LPB136_03960 [Tenacibaculum todarodis]